MLSWLVGGDLNEIKSGSEKKGGIARASNQMLRFSNAFVECGLYGVFTSGDNFTCCNKRKGEDTVWQDSIDMYVIMNGTLVSRMLKRRI